MSFPEWVLKHADDAQVAGFFALLLLFAVGEWLLPRRPEPMQRRGRWPANLALLLLNFLALGLIPVSFVSAALWAEARGIGLLNRVALPTAGAILVTLLVRAFISFGTHLLMHKIPLFWRLHRVHHLDTDLDVTTTVRFHPLEFVVSTLPGVPVVVAFGLSPWVLAGYELLDVAVTLFSHANLRVPAAVETILRYLIVTPDLHRVHHSSWQPETDSNFGAVFPLWDIVFGTYRSSPRDAHERMRLGLDEVRDRRTNNLLWLLRSFLYARLPEQGGASRRHVAA